MIGQAINREVIKKWRLKRTTPRFILIAGEGERLELAKYIAETLNAQAVIVGKGIDDIRDTIKSSYTVTKTTIYIFENGDAMSTAASNAILNITEEPPNNAYFIILLESELNTLETIRSRSTKLDMDYYSKSDLLEVHDNEEMAYYLRTPQQMVEWKDKEEEFKAFISWVKNIASNITSMKGVEAFRINEKIKLKEDSDGYDPKLFVSMLYECLFVDGKLYSLHTTQRLIESYIATMQDIQRTGIKNDSTLDMYILEIREVLKNEATH